MLSKKYFQLNNDEISFSRTQASQFAKDIANDFNPIHDEDAKRFCVPGDLLFALMLNSNGLSSHMSFSFAGMVTDQHRLKIKETDTGLCLCDDTKEYLYTEIGGQTIHCDSTIDALIKSYVAFSGESFPHVLIPLMQQHNVMINPDRPIVMYTAMSFEFTALDFKQPRLRPSTSTLVVDGKRGTVTLNFEILDDLRTVGRGQKEIVLGGLRPYDQALIDTMVAGYEERKQVA